MHLLDTDIDFALVNRGHNAGIVSEPGHSGRWVRLLQYRHGEPQPDSDAWIGDTPEQPGSWWSAWSGWLKRHSGTEISVGELAHKDSLGPAPGTYVLEP
jgi:polyhydroxyalkanoate synthase